ncbi:hypothetical protein SDJN02_14499, partial [Cucurbita argyrosperma subsp. argyrosperma]
MIRMDEDDRNSKNTKLNSDLSDSKFNRKPIIRLMGMGSWLRRFLPIKNGVQRCHVAIALDIELLEETFFAMAAAGSILFFLDLESSQFSESDTVISIAYVLQQSYNDLD